MNSAYKFLFVFTLLFILLFSGVWTLYDLYYSAYFSDSYEWYAFPAGQSMPSKLAVLTFPFRSLYHILFATVVSLVLIMLTKLLVLIKTEKRKYTERIYTSLQLSILFGCLYISLAFLFDRLLAGKLCSTPGHLKLQLICAMILYFISLLFVLKQHKIKLPSTF
jgi:hypothetical protein